MHKFKHAVIAAMTLLLTASWTVPLHAEENSMKVVLEDSIYGGLIGTVLGTAALAFTEHASDHLDYVAYGAAVGVIAGTGVGIVTSINRAVVEYENGKVKLALPTVMPDLQESSKGQMMLVVKADLIRGTF